MNITIDKALLERALGALFRSQVQQGQDNFDIQDQLREALAQPQPVQEPVADIKISGDDFDLGLTDAFAFGRLRLPDGHYQLYTSPQAQPTRPLTETQADALNTLCKMLHSGEEVEGDDGLAMLVPMDLWNEAQEAVELLIGEDDGTEAAHGITKGTT